VEPKNGEEDEALAKALEYLSRGADFLLAILALFAKRLEYSYESIAKLFEEVEGAVLLAEVADAMHFQFTFLKLLTANKKHCALAVAVLDSHALMEHAVLSALCSYYGAAHAEMRCALEGVIRGAINDLLAISSYRCSADHLREVRGFGGAAGYEGLLEEMEKEWGKRRPENSCEVYSLMDKVNFNPEAKFAKLLAQLREWGIIDDELLGDIDSYYRELSKYVHRSHPRFADVDLLSEKGPSVKPDPDSLYICLYRIVDLCGYTTLVALRVLSRDPDGPPEASVLKEVLSESEEYLSRLRQGQYKSWELVARELEELGKRLA